MRLARATLAGCPATAIDPDGVTAAAAAAEAPVAVAAGPAVGGRG